MLNYKQKYVVQDFETSGLNLRYSQPWELSWIICQGDKVISRHENFIDIPNLNLSPLIRKLTNFDEARYNRLKKPPQEVWNEAKKLIYDPEYIIIGQNFIKFDTPIMGVLAEICEEKIDYSFINRIYDTRPLALAHREGLEVPRSGVDLSWQYKILNDRSLKAKVSQGVLLKFLDIEHDVSRLHSGIYDVEMTFEIFKKLKRCLKF